MASPRWLACWARLDARLSLRVRCHGHKWLAAPNQQPEKKSHAHRHANRLPGILLYVFVGCRCGLLRFLHDQVFCVGELELGLAQAMLKPFARGRNLLARLTGSR